MKIGDGTLTLDGRSGSELRIDSGTVIASRGQALGARVTLNPRVPLPVVVGELGWSHEDPSVHIAFYEFASVAEAAKIPGSEGLKGLVAEFDRVWGNRVPRTRDVLEVVGQTER